MKICQIEADNFRTLENFSVSLQPAYCAISGKNNAGKSAVVSIIQYFFDNQDDQPFFMRGNRDVSFATDSTQWSSKADMSISVSVELDRNDDSEVFFVVETFSENKILHDKIVVRLKQVFQKDGMNRLICSVGEHEIEGQNASEILKKFRSASNLVVHNSTNESKNIFYVSSSHTEIIETHFSAEDRQKIAEAEKGLQTRVKKAAKQHKDELDKLLGKLNEKYQVELSSIETGRSSKFPLQIKLTDKSVDAPLNNWGSGTQNRTRILMSVLEAVRMRSSVTFEDRSTPVFIVEEPESFLHPSAQAEFGQILNGLAEELKIQIIATTHSPYMLNQSDPSANYLLERKIFRTLPRDTYVKDTSGSEWMIPFAENLGIIPSEFESWKPVFSSHSDRVILVEGDIDLAYFKYFSEKFPNLYTIPTDVDIVPYGGKDSLKNSSILQFMIKKFGKVFITFDLDAKNDVESALKRISLVEGSDYTHIGVATPGADCIEGLLPTVLKKKVYADQHELITAIASQDTKARANARSELKKHLLEQLQKSDLAIEDFKLFRDLFKKIGSAFVKKST